MDVFSERKLWDMGVSRAMDVLGPLIGVVPPPERPITREESEAIRVLGRQVAKDARERCDENNEAAP